jgi:prephenate dehydrogenase
MKRFNKVAIIGVGLIGGSIGLALKDRRFAKEIAGVFRRRSTLNKARARGAVDSATMDLAKGVKDADLVIVATPVWSIPVVINAIAPHVTKKMIVTDVGSTKKWIIDRVERTMKRHPALRFVGSHPMAGSEQAGVEFARADLLENAPCIVTKTRMTDKGALKSVVDFWKMLGCKVTTMDPARHDRSVSLISHLPHPVAFSLVGAVPVKEMRYAAEGFRDTTRVASSDPRLWTDIFLANQRETIRSYRLFRIYIDKMIKGLSKGDRHRIEAMLRSSKSKRDSLFYGKSS